jgi:hypothetical protein
MSAHLPGSRAQIDAEDCAMLDILVIVVLLVVILSLPATAYLIGRWGFEKAGEN